MESGKPIDDDVNFIPVEINVIHTVTDFFIVFYLLSVHVLTEQKPALTTWPAITEKGYILLAFN